MINEIDRLYKLEAKVSRTRYQVVKHAGAASLPNKTEISKLWKKMDDFLQLTLLNEEIDPKDNFLWRRIQANLIGLLVFRNGARSGTIKGIRTCFLEKVYRDRGRCAFQLAPDKLNEARREPGQRQLLNEIHREISRSYKNFYCGGVRVLVMLDHELKFLQEYLRLKEIRGESDEVFLFNRSKNPSLDRQKQDCRHWGRELKSQYRFNHKLNSTVYRQLFRTLESNQQTSSELRAQIDTAFAHSRQTVENHYVLQANKAIAGFATAQAIHETFFEHERHLPAIQEATEPIQEGHSSSSSDGSDTSDNQLYDSRDDGEGTSEAEERGTEEQQRAKVTRKNLQPSSSQCSSSSIVPSFTAPSLQGSWQNEAATSKIPSCVSEWPTKEEIANFLKFYTKQRAARTRYQLSDSDRLEVARLYLEDAKGLIPKYKFSARVRTSGLPCNLEAVRSKHKQIDDWIARGRPNYDPAATRSSSEAPSRVPAPVYSSSSDSE